MNGEGLRGRRVLITGHTGFKGAWLSEWMLAAGAEVAGYSIAELPGRSYFAESGLGQRMADLRGDIRDLGRLQAALRHFNPEVVFHLAAQPLVRLSYHDPVETFSTNVMGSVNLLEVARTLPALRALVHVTSDKCYENTGKPGGYVESDPMGGSDPYSASKGASELVFQSYARSFFSSTNGPRIATARAGNVFGAGDWAEDRILPDCTRAWSEGRAVELRNPTSTRPWQHVLDCLSGYVRLAEALCEGDRLAQGDALNFGPPSNQEWSVEKLVHAFARHWGNSARVERAPSPSTLLKEATRLTLDSTKAERLLQWHPRLNLEQALEWTARGYRVTSGAALRNEVGAQLNAYMAMAPVVRPTRGV